LFSIDKSARVCKLWIGRMAQFLQAADVPELLAPGTAKQMVGGQEYDAKLAGVVQGAAAFLDSGAVIVPNTQ
jgi:hypothetical protein